MYRHMKENRGESLFVVEREKRRKKNAKNKQAKRRQHWLANTLVCVDVKVSKQTNETKQGEL